MDAMTKTEAMLKADLNWTVSRQPVYDNQGRELSEFKAITRDDNGKVFHISRNRYTPFQNETLFNIVEEVTETGAAKYVKAGCYKEGAYVYAVVAVPDANFEVVPGDVCKTYLRISTSHDGSSSIMLWPEVYRQVCSNGMHAWVKDAARTISVRHTESAKTRLNIDAKRLLEREIQYFRTFAEQSRAMAQKEFDMLRIDSFLKELFEIEDSEDVSARTMNQMRDIAYLARRGKGVEYAPNTAWAVYNGVTEYVTHHRGSDAENRAVSALMGAGRDLRERAFALLTR